MKLVVLKSNYGDQRYFNFYLMDNGRCLSANWSKKFKTTDEIDSMLFEGEGN